MFVRDRRYNVALSLLAIFCRVRVQGFGTRAITNSSIVFEISNGLSRCDGRPQVHCYVFLGNEFGTSVRDALRVLFCATHRHPDCFAPPEWLLALSVNNDDEMHERVKEHACRWLFGYPDALETVNARLELANANVCNCVVLTDALVSGGVFDVASKNTVVFSVVNSRTRFLVMGWRCVYPLKYVVGAAKHAKACH